MFRIVATLARGAAAQACEDLADRHALPLLDQQIREAAAALDGSRRALAAALVQERTDADRHAALAARLADLEERAVAALRGNRDDLAGEAAEAIAGIEAEIRDLDAARAAFSREVAALRRTVREGARQIAELERGRRIAQAAEAARRLRDRRGAALPGTEAALAEAQATLRRLRERQAAEAACADALAAIEAEAGADVADRLEAAGFGRRTRPDRDGVMARLRARAAA
ncbi:PspA/IM30 family protein [uncultured Methylobacterium sp.]|jgi:phage shock protein A|uniref:PspA/IM30 family protein n=1 Tax=uncultured Methylobacterium sp. TaxID=157278 RepID=UPI00262C1617|nr:PspA/IM30 family protein [uncultured Methylobacterium sp.]